MEEHIAYAMRNNEAVGRWLNFNAPGDLEDWSFLAIEAILAVGIVCALAHAIRHRRNHGNPSALLTLLSCFLYGLLIDIASYYTVESFWHGEFSVMLVYNRLPLYIALFYPAFIYHACMTIRRYAFSRTVEAIATAFYAGLTYLIFDNLGPMLNWWIWDREDPTNQPFLNAVPVTSYFWFFSFTGAFAFVSRIVCWDWPAARRNTRLIVAGVAFLPVLVCLAGMALFIPYNLLAYNDMIPHAASFYALTFGAAGLTFVLRYRRPAEVRDRLLMVFPLVFVAGHLYLYVAKIDLFFGTDANGLTAEGLPAGNLIAALAAMAGSVAITLLSHPTRDEPS